MDRSTYYKRSHDLHIAEMDILDKQSEYYDSRLEILNQYKEAQAQSNDSMIQTLESNKLVQEAEFVLLEDGLKSIRAQREELDKAAKDGFDYVRKGNRFINKLLPAVPEGQKDVEKADLTQSSVQLNVLAALMALVTIVCLAASSVTFPRVTTFGISQLLNSGSHLDHGYIMSVALMGGVCSILCFLSSLNARSWYSHATQTHKRFLLGAQSWSLSQCIRSVLVYAIVDIGTLIMPVAFISGRIVYMGLAFVVYRTVYRKSQDTAQAFVMAWRFTDIFSRVFIGVGGALVLILCVFLLRS